MQQSGRRRRLNDGADADETISIAQMTIAQMKFNIAAGEGDLDGMRTWLQQGVNVDAVDVEMNCPAIILAAERMQVEAVKFLIELGADVKARSERNEGRTALISAAASGHPAALPICRLLVQNRADVNASEAGRTTHSTDARGESWTHRDRRTARESWRQHWLGRFEGSDRGRLCEE